LPIPKVLVLVPAIEHCGGSGSLCHPNAGVQVVYALGMWLHGGGIGLLVTAQLKLTENADLNVKM
jgi:hypothetical protein